MEEVLYELLYPAWTAKPLHLVKKQHINFSLGGEHTNGAKVPRGVKRSVWRTLLSLKGVVAKVPTGDCFAEALQQGEF